MKSKKLEKAIEEKNRQELLEATFKPVINTSSKRAVTPTRQGDLFERLSKKVVEKDDDKLKLTPEMFKPQLVSKRSQSVRIF